MAPRNGSVKSPTAVGDVREAPAENRSVRNVTALRDVRIMLGDLHTTHLHSRRTDPWYINAKVEKSRIESSSGGLLPDVHEWVFDENKTDFRDWLEGTSKPVLWVNDRSGKGKTMMLCSIINKLQARSSSTGDILAFFFCQAKAAHRASNAMAVLRGLIYMLIDCRKSLSAHVRREEERPDIQFFGDPSTWDSLCNIFLRILADLNRQDRSVYLLIDALDECEAGTERDGFFSLLVNEAMNPESRIKWLLASRRDQKIEDYLRGARDGHRLVELNLEHHPTEISVTIDAYIDRSVCSMVPHETEQAQEIRAKLKQRLQEKAGGDFLFVNLAVKRLSGKPPHNMDSDLEKMDMGIPEFYTEAVRRICSLNASEISLCLRLLAFAIIASRPLRDEEVIALVPELLDVELVVLVPGPLDVINRAKVYCSPFLIIGTGTLQLVHKSAKEFLCNDQNLRGILHSYQGDLFKRSLKCMENALRPDICNLRDPGFSLPSTDISKNELVKAEYACVSWIEHFLESSAACVASCYGDILDFLQNRYLCWLEAVSLLNQLPRIRLNWVKLLQFLRQHYAQAPETKQLVKLAEDAYHFLSQYGALIMAHPLQAHHAALIFAPQDSKIKANYAARGPKWLQLVTQTEKRWSPCICTLAPETEVAGSIALSPGSARLASVHFNVNGPGKHVKIWDLTMGSVHQSIDCEASWMAFSPVNPERLAITSEQDLQIWDLSSRQWLCAKSGLQISSAAVSPNGNIFATGGGDSILIWDWDGNRILRISITEDLRSLSFSADGRRLASAHPSKICLWNSRTGNPENRELEVTCSPNLVSFSLSEGNTMLAAATSSHLQSWKSPFDSSPATIEIGDPEDSLRGLAFSSCGSLFAVAYGHVIKTRLVDGENWVQTLIGYDRYIISMALSAEEKLLVTAGEQGLKVWDLTMKGLFRFPLAHKRKIRLLKMSGDGRWAASACAMTVKVWDSATGAFQWEKALEDDISSIAISQDGARLITIPNPDKSAKYWDLRRSSSEAQVIANYTLAACFSSDGSRIALVTQELDGAELFEIEISSNGRLGKRSTYGYIESETQSEDWSQLASVVFSPNSERLATSWHNAIQIWHHRGQSFDREVGTGIGTARSLCFSDNALQLAASYDDMIVVFDLSNLEGVSPLKLDTGGKRIDVVKFQNGSRQLLTNVGLFSIDTHQDRNAERSLTPRDYWIDLAGGWIRWGHTKVLKIPSDYHPEHAAVGLNLKTSSVETIALSCRFGQLAILRFPGGQPPPGLSPVSSVEDMDQNMAIGRKTSDTFRLKETSFANHAFSRLDEKKAPIQQRIQPDVTVSSSVGVEEWREEDPTAIDSGGILESGSSLTSMAVRKDTERNRDHPPERQRPRKNPEPGSSEGLDLSRENPRKEAPPLDSSKKYTWPDDSRKNSTTNTSRTPKRMPRQSTQEVEAKRYESDLQADLSNSDASPGSSLTARSERASGRRSNPRGNYRDAVGSSRKKSFWEKLCPCFF
ncbi:hypothetical protein QBC47DRAFT_93980 [Echria macrotheca]|uniref:NACHT domain-containing protein n=1 Tax=Echria macrotheca TaxID=438768 RepID=A0AAJ0F4V6_9PEZI|nr:hypothetical protein QBC47DRAFT_93980 [Echria macrotheca]